MAAIRVRRRRRARRVRGRPSCRASRVVSVRPASRVCVMPAARRSRRLALVLVLLIGSAGGCRSAPVSSSPRPDLSQSRPPSIVVAPFANGTGDVALSPRGLALQEAFTWALRRGGAIRVVEPEELFQITGRAPADLAAATRADLVTAARTLGVDTL